MVTMSMRPDFSSVSRTSAEVVHERLQEEKEPRALIRVMRTCFSFGVSAILCRQSALALLVAMSMRPNFSPDSFLAELLAELLAKLLAELLADLSKADDFSPNFSSNFSSRRTAR